MEGRRQALANAWGKYCIRHIESHVVKEKYL
jgi:hypothetical protein